MNCPEDNSTLDATKYTDLGGNVTYECSVCGGKLVQSQPSIDNDQDFLMDNQYYGKELKCPRDQDILRFEKGYFHCYMCNDYWIPKINKNENSRKDALRATVQTFGLLLSATVLYNWQMGYFSSSADPVMATTIEPMRMSAIIVWFIVFLFIILIPISVYTQMVLAHRPHQKKALHSPIVKWLPIFAIALMAVNIYFLTPR